MDLILWRHADAGVASESDEDLARPLSAKGELQAERMAAWLDQRLPETTRILVSPAVRAQQTARALSRNRRTEPLLAPDASWQELLKAIGFPNFKHNLLLVGHQPMLGLIAANLIMKTEGTDSQAMSIAKGAVVWLRQRQKSDRQEVVIRALISPEFV